MTQLDSLKFYPFVDNSNVKLVGIYLKTLVFYYKREHHGDGILWRFL